ncbi:sigma-54 dependent transcriptional regulator [Pelagicoccus sp. SDUM812002]|uniref:sigma-54-dependent transcriptional regulator n=1 Tax=Pelagicoccus sp. SDUM812002 TaxID=3041266 RepID=UPI00280FA772|nr:sigma-54 dependent transcriptional regulator [Pelagicoccus sp. SDUM812002]MDQ8187301.1 sigma-54 dependent transcriptional regulator [Pelagicoccus sp. SDUM812002]
MSALLSGREILIVEDELLLRKRLAVYLESQGASCTAVGTFDEGRNALERLPLDYVLANVKLPDGLGLDLIEVAQAQGDVPIVIMTADGGVSAAVDAMRRGASDYLAKPFDPEEVSLVLGRAQSGRRESRLKRHRNQPRNQPTSDKGLFFGDSLDVFRAQLDRVIEADRRLSDKLPPVLIEGETGTGKTSLARWLHANGSRSDKELVVVNCAALPDQLAESELFGHEKGAFSDAKQARIGLFEAADGGTLFLDEIASLSPVLQAKVLTAIEEGRIRKLGSSKQIDVNVRLIAASNQPLKELSANGEFREDLYHRLNLLCFTVPPLRDRGEDALRMADHLLVGLARKYGYKQSAFSDRCRCWISSYEWPGNVRELEHEIERALVLGDASSLEFLGMPGTSGDSGVAWGDASNGDWLNPAWELPQEGFSLEAAIDRLIDLAIEKCGGNVSKAARRIGVARDYIRYRKTKKGK